MWSTQRGPVIDMSAVRAAEGTSNLFGDATPTTAPHRQPFKLGRFTVVKEPKLPVMLPMCPDRGVRQEELMPKDCSPMPFPKKFYATAPPVMAQTGDGVSAAPMPSHVTASYAGHATGRQDAGGNKIIPAKPANLLQRVQQMIRSQ